jgi:hypothetical protein
MNLMSLAAIHRKSGNLTGALLFLMFALAAPGQAAPVFEVKLPEAHGDEPVTGRLLVVFSTDESLEPREQIGYRQGGPMMGVDVEGLAPGDSVRVDETAIGYPVENLAALPAGQYDVQALLIDYEKVNRGDGHTIWVPIAERRGISWEKSGNLYSRPRKIRFDPKSSKLVELSLTEVIPPVVPPKDTKWMKDITIRSEILSEFWGREIDVHASVLLPRGYDEHPEAHYPVVFPFGHSEGPFFFNPDPASNTEAEKAAKRDANSETGYEFYQRWISDNFPRVIAVTFENPSPYHHISSYAVNSANNGPYGRAFTEEIIPALEKQFRIIAEPYARIVEGASTGGWEALALQLYYPDYFGGAWIFNPDSISFRTYQVSNIYDDENIYEIPEGKWRKAERPFRRTRDGQAIITVRELSRFEAVLGSRGRSGYQLDIWQATYGPVGEDGYPKLLYDKETGKIDKDVASYYRDNGFDLTEYVRENWETLGPKLSGKLTFASGEMDEFYLNLGVYEFEKMIREVAPEDYPIRFHYGRPQKGHNWHHTDWAGVVREMAAHITANAPQDADIDQWNY